VFGVIQIDHTHDGRQSMYRLKGWCQNHNPDRQNNTKWM